MGEPAATFVSYATIHPIGLFYLTIFIKVLALYPPPPSDLPIPSLLF